MYYDDYALMKLAAAQEAAEAVKEAAKISRIRAILNALKGRAGKIGGGVVRGAKGAWAKNVNYTLANLLANKVKSDRLKGILGRLAPIEAGVRIPAAGYGIYRGARAASRAVRARRAAAAAAAKRRQLLRLLAGAGLGGAIGTGAYLATRRRRRRR